MKIWRVRSDENSCELTIDESKISNKVRDLLVDGFDGKPISDIWAPCYLVRYRKGRYCDFPDFLTGKTMVFPKSTFEKIGAAIQHHVEYLPVLCEDMELQLVNVTNVIDCANKEKSVADRLKTGEFLGFKKVVFEAEKIPEGTFIFKIPENVNCEIYATEKFVELVKKHKLKGFNFIEEWDSEFTEEMEQAKQRKYKETLQSIEKNKGPEFSYEEAIKKVDNGLAVASGKWKMQQDNKGRFWLGQLGEDAEYHWLMPAFIPPVLLGYLWHEVDTFEF